MKNLGRFWPVGWDFSIFMYVFSYINHLPGPGRRGAKMDGKGCHSKHHPLDSLLLNFSGFVSKKFREGSLIFGGEEDAKNHSIASNDSKS